MPDPSSPAFIVIFMFGDVPGIRAGELGYFLAALSKPQVRSTARGKIIFSPGLAGKGSDGGPGY